MCKWAWHSSIEMNREKERKSLYQYPPFVGFNPHCWMPSILEVKTLLCTCPKADNKLESYKGQPEC